MKNKKQSKTNSNAKLSWSAHKTFELELFIPKEEVAKAYQEILKHTAKQTSIKGFRQGHAPLNLVEKKVGRNSIYQRVSQNLITAKYLEAVKQHQLKPIISPKISVVKMAEGQDWIIKATACETPDINLGNWEEAIKKSRTTNKIWTPNSGQPASTIGKETSQTDPSSTTQKRLQEIFSALIKQTTIDLSQLIIEQESNRLLGSFLDQVNQLGMTLEQYLSSQNKTVDQLKKDYQTRAEQTLKLEFILAKIGEEKKLTVSAKEVEEFINKNPDEKIKKQLKSPEQKTYIASIVRKRKTLDYLLSL